MGRFWASISFFGPRAALVVMFFTGYGQAAFDTWVWPIIGFLFVPFATCAYAIGMNENAGIAGWSLVLLVVALVLDVAAHGGLLRKRSHLRKRDTG